jgi:hypothetical protein
MLDVVDYPYQMMKDGRVVSILENGKMVALVFFSLCDDETEHLWNWDYKYHPHNPNGKILVLEGLVCERFTFSIVKKMKEVFYEKFPQIEKTVWRRDNRSNRKITYRRQHEFHHSN